MSQHEEHATHIRICNDVLQLWQDVGRKIGATFVPETWDLFIKIVLGMVVSKSGLGWLVGQSLGPCDSHAFACAIENIGVADSMLSIKEGEHKVADELTDAILNVWAESTNSSLVLYQRHQCQALADHSTATSRRSLICG
jgi:hypothetical protein